MYQLTTILLLKNLISELEKQLSEKNALKDFLTSQLIAAKPRDATKNINSSHKYHHKIADSNKSTHSDAPLEKSKNE